MNILNLFKFRKLVVGDRYRGGKIAYLDETGLHGLIAAKADQSNGIVWIKYFKQILGASGVELGSGLANTNKIYNSTGSRSSAYAAGIARSYRGGGYSDWYLPSKDELNLLYISRTRIGGFQSSFYWSSSECDENSAWLQFFSNGVQFKYEKSGTYFVRAIRAF
ncbi:MAG: DUF1566 domain-containing protein [Mariniphaga sp.]